MARQYDIQRATGQCGRCGEEIAPGGSYTAAVFDEGEGFRREDLCPACAEAAEETIAAAFSTWVGRIPEPEDDEEQRRRIDDDVLLSFFHRLADEEEPSKVSFRFVLALMLMRRKRLVRRAARREEGREIWTMQQKNPGGSAAGGGQSEPIEVVHPDMDAEQLAAVTEQLSILFEVEQ
jgi:hypothetical protein